MSRCDVVGGESERRCSSPLPDRLNVSARRHVVIPTCSKNIQLLLLLPYAQYLFQKALYIQRCAVMQRHEICTNQQMLHTAREETCYKFAVKTTGLSIILYESIATPTAHMFEIHSRSLSAQPLQTFQNWLAGSTLTIVDTLFLVPAFSLQRPLGSHRQHADRRHSDH